MLKKTSNYIWLILILALVLRFIGINHGFPFIFHPDEPTIIRSAYGIRYDFNTKHFDWPHLYIYINHFLYIGFVKVRNFIVTIGYKDQVQAFMPLIWDDSLNYYLLTRSLSALLGALTVIPLYLTSKTIFGKKAGLLSSLALAITPFHVWHSHYSLTDVPMMFMLSWSLFFSSKVLFKKDVQNYIWAGLFVGLAASTKYNGLLIAGALVLAHIFRVFSEREEKIFYVRSWSKLILAGLVSVFGFLVGTPYAVLDYKTFLRTDGPKGALWQFTNVGKVSFIDHVSQFFSVLVNKLPENFGYTVLILFLLSTLYVLFNMVKTKKMWINKDLLYFGLIGVGLIYYVSGLEKTRAHYFFIAYPAIIMGGVGFLCQQLEKISYKFKNLIWLVVFLPPLYFSAISSYTFYNYDTRQQLYFWLSSRISENRVSKVYYYDSDLKFVLEKSGAVSSKKIDIIQEVNDSNYYLVVTEEDMDIFISGNRKKVLSLDSKFRKGPIIEVYSP